MGQGFRKFQNRVRLGALVKALLAALAVGLPVFSVLFVLIKRELITMRVLVAVLIAVGAVLVSFALILIVQLPGKKRLAKRLASLLKLLTTTSPVRRVLRSGCIAFIISMRS